MFQCTNSHECISAALVCDTKRDCHDGSDENNASCEILPSKTYRPIVTNIALVVTAVILILLLFGVFCCVKRSKLCRRKDAVKNNNAEMLPGKLCNGGTFSSLNESNQRGVAVSSYQGSSCRMSFPSTFNYDRNHVTGASSSSSSRGFPLETLGPPPSPVTVRSQYHQGSLSSYKYYHARNKPPPPTPCSTDVCDDSEACSTHYYGSGCELGYESDPFIPPPPTPHSPYLSEENYELLGCPYPPPPSPVLTNNLRDVGEVR